MFNDSQDLMPWAITSVRRDCVGDYLPAASPLITAFYLADAGGDIKSEKYFKPGGVDTPLVLTPRGHIIVWQASQTPKARGNPRQAKTGESTNDFWGENYSKDVFVMVCFTWERAKLSVDMIWQAWTSILWLTEHRRGCVRYYVAILSPWLMIFRCYLPMLCCNVLISSEQ